MARIRASTLAVLAVLALPGLAQAAGFGRRGGSSNSSSSSSSSKSSNHNAAPVGTPHAATNGNRSYGGGNYQNGRYYSGGRYYGGRYYGGYGYYGQPYAWGWGIHPWGYYGWGYYPVYGGPAVYAEAPPPPTTTSNLFLGGLFTRDGAGLNLKLGVDGRRWGGNFDLLTLPSPNGDGTVTAMPLLKGHITYSIFSDLHARVRLEGGIAGIGAPDVTYVGPDVGASATLAVAGPLALEGSAHWMPVPASILDLEGAVGLNFGALGLRGGWRWVRLDDSSQGGGVDIYNGPMLSVGVLF